MARKKTSTRKPASDDSEHTPAAPQPEAGAVAHELSFPIVGIGASAGGLGAYEALLSAMPTDMDVPMAFVIVQHLSPDHRSLLTELVQRYAKMRVSEVEDGTVVEPNHVYIIPPDRDMALEGGSLRLYPPSEPRGHRLPIDFFFRSLAREHRERSICIVLSGSGSDGTLGMRAVKGEGGMAMAQDPDTTEHAGMPSSAISTGLVDYVLAPADMPATLISYARHAFIRRADTGTPAPADDSLLKRVTSLLKAQTRHDFSHYKPTTILRRMERRMALRQIVDRESYLRSLKDDPAELEAFFRDLLIGVTSFFRDPEAFAALEQKLIGPLLEAETPRDPFRVWVCGCSTGEEAYSLAILLQEHMERSRRPARVQIFATDIDFVAIEQARAGAYPESIAADVTPERLRRFFVHDREHECYRVQKVIRDMLVFSEQDVLRDPPFSKLDVISCRNLLIYLNAEAQRRLIPLFHYALSPGGGLFLGSSETIGEFARLFTPLDRKWRIYRRENVTHEKVHGVLGEVLLPPREQKERSRAQASRPPAEPLGSWRHLTEQALLAHYAEAGVLVNGRGDILYILGKTGKYLEPAAGDAALNIVAMARDGLRRELSTALHKAVAQRQPSHHAALQVKSNGGHIAAQVTVRPVELGPGTSSDLYLVILEETPIGESADGEAPPLDSATYNKRVTELEHELKAKEDYLQTTLEEMETTNEELKSTNEEMQSVNEELQSTNEELETSKEELQSLNEELSTVNAELQEKVSELSRANNDMNNLLAGTGVGTVFVDHTLRIMRFTPSATQVINLIPADVGRPVAHIVSNLRGYDGLVEEVRHVIDDLVSKEAEVQTKSGAWYLMRIRPYRTIDNTIEGAVLTFVDISDRKRIEEGLRKGEQRFRDMVDRALAGIIETDPTGRISYVNDRFCEMTGYPREQLTQTTVQALTHPEDAGRSRSLLKALADGGPDFAVEKRYLRKDGSAVRVSERVSASRDTTGKVNAIVAVAFDAGTDGKADAGTSEP
ncbi:MAG: chemotaxis protein CheB [Gemmatimonadales bacterium]